MILLSIGYSENQFLPVAIRKVRPDVLLCFDMTRDGPHKKLSVRYALSGETILELRELARNRISLGSVQSMLCWQLGLTEQQNIVSHEQPLLWWLLTLRRPSRSRARPRRWTIP